MKYLSKQFSIKLKPRRLEAQVWKKYYSLKKKDKLEEMDKFWVRQVRAALKVFEYEAFVTHIPTGVTASYIVKGEKPKLKELIKRIVVELQQRRKKAAKANPVVKNFDGASYAIMGGVFQEGNKINEIGKRTTTNDPYAPKHPRRKDKNYIGIELEFLQVAGVSQGTIANALKAANLARYVDVTTDGSCGWEVRVLLPEDDFQQPLAKIMKVIRDLGHTVNTTCGTHVHFDMRNRDVKTVYENLFKSQNLLRKFVTRNRKYNTYCKKNKAESFDKQLSLGDRYYALNVQAYSRHKTLEVRLHQGTLAENELFPWIQFLLRIVNYKPALETPVNTLRQAKKQFDIPQELVQNLEKRIFTVFGRVMGA